MNQIPTDIQAILSVARVVDHHVEERKKTIQKKTKKKDAARELSGIFDVPPEDESYEDTVRNATKKLQRPASPAMPCTTSVHRMRGRDRPPKTGRDSTRLNSRNVYWKQKVKHF